MRSRRPLILVSVVTAAALSLLATGCGGSSPGIASVAGSATTTTTTQGGAVAYARCMRSRGVSTFPDPDSSGEFEPDQLKSIRVAIPLMRAANSACSHLLPNGLSKLVAAPQDSAQQTRTRIADGLSFAKCMRSRGVSRFPDPTAQGELSIEMVQRQGIDVRSPAVLRVVQACLPASHGALTPAGVREALREAHS